MIIWRGWGILAFLYSFASFLLTGALYREIWPHGGVTWLFGAGLIVAGVASWFTGVALNRTVPRRRLEGLVTARRTELAQYVANGTFSLGPGYPIPQTQDEARRAADALLEMEQEEGRKRLFNQHTFFFIPLQYWAFILIAVGVLSAIFSH